MAMPDRAERNEMGDDQSNGGFDLLRGGAAQSPVDGGLRNSAMHDMINLVPPECKGFG